MTDATGEVSLRGSAMMYSAPCSRRNSGISKLSPGPGVTHAASSGSSRNFSAAVSTMRTVAPVLSAAPRIWATLLAHVRRPFARKIRSGCRVSPPTTHS